MLQEERLSLESFLSAAKHNFCLLAFLAFSLTRPSGSARAILFWDSLLKRGSSTLSAMGISLNCSIPSRLHVVFFLFCFVKILNLLCCQTRNCWLPLTSSGSCFPVFPSSQFILWRLWETMPAYLSSILDLFNSKFLRWSDFRISIINTELSKFWILQKVSFKSNLKNTLCQNL